MFAFFIAALCVVYQMVSQETPVLTAVESVLPFLKVWYTLGAIFIFAIWMVIPLCGAAIGCGARSCKEHVTGMGLILASPLLLCLMLFSSGLFIGGIYCIDSGLQDGAVVNQSNLIAGCILYGLALLLQLGSRSKQKSSN